MHDLWKFLRRNSNLFVYKYGMALPVREPYTKFLANRYGEVKHYYSPRVEMAVIEADIKRLIDEEYIEETFKRLLDPPVDYF